jgi:hypothetical protein
MQLTRKEASRSIKNTLVQVFPGAKFSVRLDGNSIDVEWTDGPTYLEVLRHIGHMRAGYSEDGQYIYTKNCPWPNLYLSASRVVSGQGWRAVMEIFQAQFPQVDKEGSFRYLSGDTYRWEADPEKHTSGVDWDRLYRHAVGGYDCMTKKFIYSELINDYKQPDNWQHGEPALETQKESSGVLAVATVPVVVVSVPEDRPEIVEDAYLTYLDVLRESGVTNMFGACPYLQEEFFLSQEDARSVLFYWMRSFGRESR